MTKHFPIESGIPVPGRRHKYPWDQMKVGDSFFVPAEEASGPRVRSAMSSHSRHKGGMFVSRSVDGGTRVWRVE